MQRGDLMSDVMQWWFGRGFLGGWGGGRGGQFKVVCLKADEELLRPAAVLFAKGVPIAWHMF